MYLKFHLENGFICFTTYALLQWNSGDGGDLRLHLQKLVEAENVQDFIKNNPFGQEAITEASESWEFYREAFRILHITPQTYRLTKLIR